MVVLELDELKTVLNPGQRLLGLDLGKKAIGLALSDTSLTVATPLTILAREKFSDNATRLDALIAEHGIGGLIVGLPLNMDGSAGRSAQSARAFARNFARRSSVPLAMVDERLSTVAANRVLLEADSSRKKRAETLDKVAAAYILQGALDQMRAG
jgi:putative Holliday junction resolvase